MMACHLLEGCFDKDICIVAAFPGSRFGKTRYSLIRLYTWCVIGIKRRIKKETESKEREKVRIIEKKKEL